MKDGVDSVQACDLAARSSVPSERLERLVGPSLGVARSLNRLPRRHGEPRVFLYGAEMARFGPRGDHQTREACCGSGLADELARGAALGEVAETSAAACVDPRRVQFASWQELRDQGQSALEPERFALYSEDQYRSPGFPYRPFTRETRVGWIEGWSHVRRAPIRVPASRAYLPWTLLPGEPEIGFQCSTGLAAGASREQAIRAGLFENLERDAFMLFWLDRLPARRVELAGFEALRLFEDRFAVPGWDYRIFELITDLPVPVILVLLVCPSPLGELVVAGAASRLDREQAVLKALLEAVQAYHYVRRQVEEEPDWLPAPDFSNVSTFEAHGRLYSAAPELRPVLRAIEDRIVGTVPLESLDPVESPSPEADLDRLVGLLAERGYEAVVVDLTTPDVASLGLSVVRVLTPELQPLHGNHRHPHLGGRRLRDVPVRLGLRRPDDPPPINPFPHPFA